MSEYQRFEFAAIDKPLSERQMRALRDISSRADITPTRFSNEYHWGRLKADPVELLAKYFDVHLYVSNFSTARFAVRLPAKLVNLSQLRKYLRERAWASGGFVICDFFSQTEPDSDAELEPDLAVLTPIRDLLLAGDLRPAFLAWLASAQEFDGVNMKDTVPPIPEGLRSLTPALVELADLLLLDSRLLAAAAKLSAPARKPNRAALRRWVKALSTDAKTDFLTRAAEQPDLRVGHELRAQFGRTFETEAAVVSLRVSELFAAAGISPD